MTESKLETLRRFVADEPGEPFNHYSLALEYVNLKQYAEAIGKFEETLKIDSQYVPAYQQLGMLYGQLGRVGEAMATFAMGIAVAHSKGDFHAEQEMQDALEEME